MPSDIPETVPDMMTECPVCMEPLFDGEGVSRKEIAKIMCCHLVHNDCLVEAAKALNSQGERYGIGGLGLPRAGCPVCNEEVTMWVCYNEAAQFPIFWMKHIQNCLEEVGPKNGKVPVKTVQRMLKASRELTNAQKEYIDKEKSSFESGFQGGIIEGSGGVVKEKVDGGFKMYWKEGAWEFDKINDTLWMRKWGPTPPVSTSSAPG
mmetsp:Transcript_45812/g.111035  ORF Transcript_45812/g.111035 Transcript_45812/m.111035 type:complete len:206 (-) Transcript_45812:332-949(-)|eukprot:CAMPEP_0113644798 /NCGR_PEP_ID=MMETSP0017_2-20120614/23585_1 /TAXON_ID=2856 /ORGANISM="Cylindrotheca closterium" /LENGTH=205 /DNA_ID=CAMNT_0000556443 /DNA_START=120 /DNA_END=737 /DNA_ORIENTATION=+ /assembly_acc=CAM_ASM_000147